MLHHELLQASMGLLLICGLAVTPSPGADATYGDTPAGLKKLNEDILAAIKAGRKDAAAGLIKSLVMPNSEAWFKKTFGEQTAAQLLPDYTRFAAGLETEGTKFYEEILQKGRTQVSAVRIENAEDANATGAQKAAIHAMQVKTPLYTVKFVEPGKTSGTTLWSFVFVENSFRLIGKLRMRPAP